MNKGTAGWALPVLVVLLTACSGVPTSQEKGQAGPLPGFPEASLTIFPVTLNVTGPTDETAHHQRFAEACRSAGAGGHGAPAKDDEDGRAAHAVHFVVCDRAGDRLIMDLQNSHCEDFQQIRPKTVADCDRFVLERLESLLR
jgi:hypothetical protein